MIRKKISLVTFSFQFFLFKNLAYSLHLMLDYLDAKDDCYSLGLLSKIVSHELNSMQLTKLRRKVCQIHRV